MKGKEEVVRKNNRVSLKTRLLLIVVFTLFISLFGEIYLQVHNWREAIKSEVDSSFNLAKHLVDSGIIDGHAQDLITESRILNALQGLRHIRLIVKYRHNVNLISTGNISKFQEAGVPDWFVKLIYPYQNELPQVVLSNSNIIIQADPNDEIIEVWEDFHTQLITIVCFSIFVSIFIYIALYFGLKPLNKLQKGFEKLETGSFDVKLSENAVSELSIINHKFNNMVDVLKRTSEDNSMLTRKMLNLQEEEHKVIARELHDEMAPHLFGIRISASNANSFIKQKEFKKLSSQLQDIDRIVENLQNQVRRMLTRLRPLVLDDLTIKDAIYSLIQKKEISELNIDWSIEMENLDDALDDTTKVSLYRIIQESITNIVRHSHASKVVVIVMKSTEQGDFHNPMLKITLEDNGNGIAENIKLGFGLMGIRERVLVLGGSFDMVQSDLGGIKLQVQIPLV